MDRRLSLLCVVALLALAGCAPIQSTALLLDADDQLEAARQAGAEQFAPYPYAAAVAYTHQAREEVGFSRYALASSHAQTAVKLASDARELALRQAKLPVQEQTPTDGRDATDWESRP